MTRILLIRHGENDFVGKRLAGRLPGVHLNARGRAQAEAIARALANAALAAIYASPLERTLETAQPLAQALSLPVHPHPGLLEVDFGAWQGKTGKQMRRLKLWHTVQHHPSQMTFPGGESFLQAQQRGVAAIEEFRRTHDPKATLACFSHCDLIRLIIAHYTTIPLDNFQRLTADTASISMLELFDGWSNLVFLNRTANDNLVTGE